MKLAVLMFMVTMGCVAPMTQYEREQFTRNDVTVQVNNTGMDAMRVYLLAMGTKQFLGSLIGGETGCYTLHVREQMINLMVSTIDGDWTSPMFIAEDSPSRGWTWSMGMTPRYDVLSLVPARQKCRR